VKQKPYTTRVEACLLGQPIGCPFLLQLIVWPLSSGHIKCDLYIIISLLGQKY